MSDDKALDATLPAGPSQTVASTAPGPARESISKLSPVEAEHYEMGNQLGKGGMGTVVVARDRRLGRLLAVKVSQAADPARFTREAVLTARLQHPSIIPVHEAGLLSGEPFYAMKLVAGQSLAKLIARTQDLDERLALIPNVIAVVDALAYAHAQRVIHRDLKPDNVIVGEYGETIVIDWGLAKELDADDQDQPSPYRSDDAQTVAGAAMGTPPYMPPEQAAGEVVDERADVYGLGAMLYHVLAGVPPYEGKTADEVMDRVLAGPPKPLAERIDGIPTDLLAIVDKAMARAPADRYANAKQLADDLKRFERGQLVAAHAYSRRELVRRWLARHRTAVAIAAIAMVAVGVAITLWVRAEIRERVAREQRDAQVLRDANTDHAVAIAQIKADKFSEARDTMRREIDKLEAAGLANRERTVEYEQVRRLDEFYRHAKKANVLAGDEDRTDEALRELTDGLRELGAIDSAGKLATGKWWNTIQIAELSDVQRRHLAEEGYRQLLFLAFLHFKAGTLLVKVEFLIMAKSPESAAHFRAMFDALAQTAALERELNIRGARVARIWQTMALYFLKGVGTEADVAAVGKGPLTETPNDPNRVENAIDYWFLGAGHFLVAQMKGTPMGTAAEMTFPDLFDYKTPLVTAERQLRTAIRIDPQQYWPHFLLGWTLRTAGDLGGAEIALDACLQIAPDNPLCYGQRAQTLGARAKRETGAYREELLARALEDSDRMIALDPKYPVSYWSRADLMRDLERHTEAVAAYTRALELESNVAGKFSRRVRMPEIRAYVEGLPQTAQTQALLALVAAKSN